MLVGLDLGTFAARTFLVEGAQGSVAERVLAAAALAASRPRRGWTEQGPRDWERAACAAMRALARQAPAAVSAVRPVELSGQVHGAIFVDADGELAEAICTRPRRAASSPPTPCLAAPKPSAALAGAPSIPR